MLGATVRYVIHREPLVGGDAAFNRSSPAQTPNCTVLYCLVPRQRFSDAAKSSFTMPMFKMRSAIVAE